MFLTKVVDVLERKQITLYIVFKRRITKKFARSVDIDGTQSLRSVYAS